MGTGLSAEELPEENIMPLAFTIVDAGHDRGEVVENSALMKKFFVNPSACRKLRVYYYSQENWQQE